MNRQEIFNTVATHLLKQNARATQCVDPEVLNPPCNYRDQEGRKCAVGILIPDELYTPEIEGVGPHNSPLREILTRQCSIDYGDLQLLADLQVLHDEVSPADWPTALEHFARTRDLNYTPKETA